MGFGIKTRIRSFLYRHFPPFEPYIMDIQFKGCRCRFFYGTPLAKQWYDPIVPFVQKEIDWILENINLKNQIIIDGGAHHGLYSVIFAVGSQYSSEVISVDPVDSNCALLEVNMALNHAQAIVERYVISDCDGVVLFSFDSNGRIVKKWGQPKPAKRLASIRRDATIVKLDVEGAEFIILPDQMDQMPQVHTWIVELHPSGAKSPDNLINQIRARGFDIYWINRLDASVESFSNFVVWTKPVTIFAIRK